MQHQSSAPRAPSGQSRLALHECGCFVEYVTDKHGEYPLSVEGCSVNDYITERLRSGELSDSAFVAAIKGHRGQEIR